MPEKLKLGVFGLGRGFTLAASAELAGMKINALCDRDEKRLITGGTRFIGTVHADFEDLLSADIDAVLLANDFDDHSSFAVRALHAGKHVMSETTACTSLEEAKELIAAVRETGLLYQFAENYAFKAHVREIARLYGSGELGECQYAECEYTHALSPEEQASFGADPAHWRAQVSPTAYSTHAIAPLMAVTGAMPLAVSASLVGDTATVMLIRMSDGSLLKSLHGFLQGEQWSGWSWLRVHGTKALAENLRHGPSAKVRFRREAWVTRADTATDMILDADPIERPNIDLPTENLDDFLMCENFQDNVDAGETPFFDVYRATAVSLVGALAGKSLEENGAFIDLPDVRSL